MEVASTARCLSKSATRRKEAREDFGVNFEAHVAADAAATVYGGGPAAGEPGRVDLGSWEMGAEAAASPEGVPLPRKGAEPSFSRPAVTGTGDSLLCAAFGCPHLHVPNTAAVISTR